MSYSTGGKTMSSSSTYHKSLSADGPSRITSLSSQLNQYNSESTPSSQTYAENKFYRDNNNNQDLDDEIRFQSGQKLHTPFVASSLPRSSPIAIIRPPGNSKDDIVECDVDDDDSVIDVEGDAIKLRRKYGNKIIQTYIQDATFMKSSSTKMREKSASILNAPYLGSLSKSSNQVLSLPPISLAGDGVYLGEPPESIVSYGSLRDSHERGRFLDGPSSYREPSSGKIRQLDHRLRYHGRQPELNIGERLQQSRKLKEMRLKEESKRKKKEPNRSNNEEGDNERKETKSSLSAIMRDASQNLNTGSANVSDSPGSDEVIGIEHDVSVHGGDSTPINRHENRSSLNFSPRNMLSTSLTAFELLKSSNTDTTSGCNNVTPYYPETHFTDVNHSLNYRPSSSFQPLARSMSDPSPRFQNLSLSEISTNSALTATQTGGLLAHTKNSLTGTGQRESHIQVQHGTQQATNYKLVNDDYFMCEPTKSTASGSIISGTNANFNDRNEGSPQVDHDPDIDGAFGDIDM